MPRIPEKLIKEIEDKTNIVDVVSEHVYLKPHGRNYVGICPFHTEGLETFKRIKRASCLILPLAEQTAGRTAAETRKGGPEATIREITRKMPREHQENRAFSVNPELQIYKCFSCGAGGPVFKFVQDIADVSFTDAVYALAQRCDVEMPERQK